ncbi:MAG: HIT domain-containing protein [Nitrospirota bacterium]|jgi:diadenosine tetraphosphate (Ap4A) HIT family hydrolase
MTDFHLDPQLARDCFVLGELGSSLLLLLDNALVPWFIVVPRVVESEVYQLEREHQQALLEQVNALSRLLKDRLGVHKVNVAAIGNVVQQLHVHVVGRREGDFCWPGVVWGAPGRESYATAEVERIRGLVAAALGEEFTPASEG